MHQSRADEAEYGKPYNLFCCSRIHKEEEILGNGKSEGGSYHVDHPVHGLVKAAAAADEDKDNEKLYELFYEGVYPY